MVHSRTPEVATPYNHDACAKTDRQISVATIFDVIPSPVEEGRVRLGFTHDNTLRFAAVKVLGYMTCADPSDPEECPK